MERSALRIPDALDSVAIRQKRRFHGSAALFFLFFVRQVRIAEVFGATADLHVRTFARCATFRASEAPHRRFPSCCLHPNSRFTVHRSVGRTAKLFLIVNNSHVRCKKSPSGFTVRRVRTKWPCLQKSRADYSIVFIMFTRPSAALRARRVQIPTISRV